MHSLERNMNSVLNQEFSGEYRIGSLGVLTDHFVLPVLLKARERYPLILPRLLTLMASEANQQLKSGQLEVAFYYDAISMPQIECHPLGSLTNSIYCGKGHPLFGKRQVGTDRLLQYEFSVPAIGDRGTPMDSWPVEIPRKVGFRITMLSSN